MSMPKLTTEKPRIIRVEETHSSNSLLREWLERESLPNCSVIVADFLHVEQHSIVKRLLICVPMFIVAIGILLYSQKDAAGFDMIWRYFAWTNQTLAVFTLWALTVYLAQARKNYWITLLPALFMSAVCSTYILVAPEGLHLPTLPSQIAGIVIACCLAIAFFLWRGKRLKED